jgi:hypothetical protein
MPATDSSLKGPKPVALCAIQLLLSWRLRVTYRERRARRAVDSAPRASIEGSTELSSVPELAGAERDDGASGALLPCTFSYFSGSKLQGQYMQLDQLPPEYE